MFASWPLLSLLIWVPIIGAALVLVVGKGDNRKAAFTVALITSLITILLCIPLYQMFDTTTANWQFVELVPWVPAYNLNYYLGVDGISMPLIILTSYTTLIVVYAAKRMIHKKLPQYLASFLVLQALMVGAFCALDSILFYIFLEAMLIPMYLSIGIWGSENRSYAAIKFFIFTFLGSALLLVAILYLGLQAGDFAIESFYPLQITMGIQILLFIAFFLAFAVKIPI